MANQTGERAAPYVSWTTFLNAVTKLAEGMPNQIDRSVFDGYAWTVQNTLIAALRTLALIDDAGKPTKLLHKLAVPDEAQRKKVLEEIFRESYSEVFALDLQKATPQQVDACLAEHYNAGGETGKKAVRFFMSGISYLGIPVSTFLAKAKPSAAGGAPGAPRRRGRTRRPQREDNGDDGAEAANPSSGSDGEEKTIQLRSGGTATLRFSVKMVSMSTSDRKFLFGLLDQLSEYEEQATASKGEES